MMNFNEADILNALVNGEDIDAIAKRFTDTLNSAKAKMNQKEDKLNELTQKVIDAIGAYVSIADPELGALINTEVITVKDMREVLDDFVKTYGGLVKAVKGLSGNATLDDLVNTLMTDCKPKTLNSKAKATAKKTDDEIINEFLKDLHLFG